MSDASGGIHRDLIADGMCGRGHSINGETDVTTDTNGVQRCRRCLAEMRNERGQSLDVVPDERHRRKM